MEIQNLRLQLLHIANGDVQAAQAMETYVMGGVKSAQLGEEPKTKAEASSNGSEPVNAEPQSILGKLLKADGAPSGLIEIADSIFGPLEAKLEIQVHKLS